MKFCEACRRTFDTDDGACPDCGAPLCELQPGEMPEDALTVEELLLLGLL